jgi:C1A family cysteine protease
VPIKPYKLGCFKDKKDLRDIPMGLVLPPIKVPTQVDYSKAMTAVRDQGDEGTCVAFASVVGVKEYQDTKEYRKGINLSPRYLYSLCKSNDGIPDEDGTYPRVAMKMLLKYGVSPESYWPYRPYQKDACKPGADKAAKTYMIKAYARLSSVQDMKRSLVVNGPFLAGVDVFASWFTDKVSKTGVVPLPKAHDELQGGHAICIMGYDDSNKIFKFKNSWSRQWGDKGYGYIKYEYVTRHCSDAWSGTDLIENPEILVKKREELLSRYA